MRLDDYVITERDERRLAAALSDPETRKRVEQSLDEAYKTLHWRIQHEGYKLALKMFPLISSGWRSIRNSTRICTSNP